MTDTAQLVRLIQESKMPDEFKERLVPIAQVASEKDKLKIKYTVLAYDLRFAELAAGKAKLTPKDVFVFQKSE